MVVSRHTSIHDVPAKGNTKIVPRPKDERSQPTLPRQGGSPVVRMTETVTEKSVWSGESYAEVAPKYLSMAGQLVESVAPEPGQRVLDIGCGTGNVAITAARRGADVTGIDVTPSMLDIAARAGRRAGVEGIDWQVGDATNLPFDDDSFDVTVSALGHMYADPPADATAELLRVTRPGGQIGFTSWTPTSLYPSMAGILMTYVAPEELPDFSEPPFMWGDAGTVERRLDEGVDTLECATETVWYPALSPRDFFEHTAEHSGLFADVFAAVDESERPAARDQIVGEIANWFDPARNAVELEYLCSTATVRDS